MASERLANFASLKAMLERDLISTHEYNTIKRRIVQSIVKNKSQTTTTATQRRPMTQPISPTPTSSLPSTTTLPSHAAVHSQPIPTNVAAIATHVTAIVLPFPFTIPNFRVGGFEQRFAICPVNQTCANQTRKDRERQSDYSSNPISRDQQSWNESWDESWNESWDERWSDRSTPQSPSLFSRSPFDSSEGVSTQFTEAFSCRSRMNPFLMDLLDAAVYAILSSNDRLPEFEAFREHLDGLDGCEDFAPLLAMCPEVRKVLLRVGGGAFEAVVDPLARFMAAHKQFREQGRVLFELTVTEMAAMERLRLFECVRRNVTDEERKCFAAAVVSLSVPVRQVALLAMMPDIRSRMSGIEDRDLELIADLPRAFLRYAERVVNEVVPIWTGPSELHAQNTETSGAHKSWTAKAGRSGKQILSKKRCVAFRVNAKK